MTKDWLLEYKLTGSDYWSSWDADGNPWSLTVGMHNMKRLSRNTNIQFRLLNITDGSILPGDLL